MVTYLGGSILITIFALGGSIVSYNLHSLIFSGSVIVFNRSKKKGTLFIKHPDLDYIINNCTQRIITCKQQNV